jgi:TolB-like protein
VSETRKLAAILVSDVVGYSRLAGTDEDRILARLRTLRSDLIDPTIAVHHGRIVKRTGDGSIIEFRSVVDAVRCAIEVQSGLAERNAGVPPEKRNANQDYLGDVLTEELTTSLSRLPDSFVVSRTTAFAYRGKAEDVKDIGKELGVRYVLEGSAQKSGARIRVNAQLIDAGTGAHLWADQFDADQGEMLEMQDEIVTRLARALQIRLAAVEASRVRRSHPENPNAEELAMQCEAGYLRSGITGNVAQLAFALCERALAMDSRNVRALAILAVRSVAWVITLSSDDPKAELGKADELSARAVAVDPNNYLAHYARALFLAPQRPDEGMAEAERALALNPSFLPTYVAFWRANWTEGRPEKANEYAETALRLSPRDPINFIFLRIKGVGLFSLSRYEEAADACRRTIALNPQDATAYMWWSASLALGGWDAEAVETLKRYLALPGAARSIGQIKGRQPFEAPFVREVYDRVYGGLRKAGLKEE